MNEILTVAISNTGVNLPYCGETHVFPKNHAFGEGVAWE